MEIYGANSVDSSFLGKKKVEKTAKKKGNIGQNQTQVQRNSLSEAIGRSLVSFRGGYNATKKYFEYNNQTLMNGSESFIYDKDTGKIDYSEYTPSGELKKSYKYDPDSKTEVVATIDAKGIKEVKLSSPETVSIERFLPNGDRFYLEELDVASGLKATVSTERGRHREVVRTYKGDKQTSIEVRDLRTDKLVSFGPLVEDYVDGENGYVYLQNIVNGDIYEKKLESSGRVLDHEKYSRKTLALIYKYSVDNKTGDSVESEFTEDGAHVLSEKKCSRSGTLLSMKKYNPETFNISEEYIYDPVTKSTDVLKYDSDGVILFRKKTEKDGTVSKTKYEDGIPKSLRIISKNAREIENFTFTDFGDSIATHDKVIYGRNRQVKSHIFFLGETDLISKEISYKSPDCYTETKYSVKDEGANVPVSAKVIENGKVVSRMKFYPDGITVRKQTDYNFEDGSYVSSFFTEEAKIDQKHYHTADGDLYKIETFDSYGRLYERETVKKASNRVEYIKYDSSTGRKESYIEQDLDGNYIKSVDFYSDGKTPKEKKLFSTDGTFTRIKYDENGRVTSKTVESMNEEPTQKTESKKTVAEEVSDQQSKLEKKLSSFAARVRTLDKYTKENIPADELAALSQYIGIQNLDLLFSLDKQQVREIASIFDPDIDTESERYDFDAILITLVSNQALNKISDAASNSDKPIKLSKFEKEFLAQLTEFESYQEFLKLDKRQYRKLSSKFHPDKYVDPAIKQMVSKVFTIIGNVYSRSPNYNR